MIMEKGSCSYVFPSRILLVDDNAVCLKAVALMLERCGYQVVTASNGRECIDILRRGEIQVDGVFTDLHMSMITGYDVVNHVKLHFNIPVIMMSADSRTKTVRKGLDSGAACYVVKPLTKEDVRDIMQRVFAEKIRELYEEAHLKLPCEISLPRVFWQIPECGSSINVDQSKDKEPKGKGIRRLFEVLDEDDEPKKQPKIQRLDWSPELHNLFLDAIHTLDGGMMESDDEPASIQRVMRNRAPFLTKQNISSHLQKHRKGERQREDRKVLEKTQEKELRSLHINRRALHVNERAGQNQINTSIWNSPMDKFSYHTQVASNSNSPNAQLMYRQQHHQQQQLLQLQQQQQILQLQHLQQLQQQQPWISNSLSVDKQTLAPDYNLLRNNPGGLVNDNIMLTRSEVLNNNPVIRDFNGFKFQDQNNIEGATWNMGPFPTLNRAKDFNTTNNTNAGNQNLNNNNMFNQPARVAGSSSFIQAVGPFNLQEVTHGGTTRGASSCNMPVGTNITTQRVDTSNMFAGANQVQEIVPNSTEHEQQTQVVNHAMDDQLGEGGLDQLMRNMANLDSDSQFFSAVELGNSLSNQREQGGEAMMDYFNFDLCDKEINPGL